MDVEHFRCVINNGILPTFCYALTVHHGSITILVKTIFWKDQFPHSYDLSPLLNWKVTEKTGN